MTTRPVRLSRTHLYVSDGEYTDAGSLLALVPVGVYLPSDFHGISAEQTQLTETVPRLAQNTAPQPDQITAPPPDQMEQFALLHLIGERAQS